MPGKNTGRVYYMPQERWLMKYATVCSGIGAPEVAWQGLWGAPEFVSEIEPFPSAVLKHHIPDVPNYGDMTKYKRWPDHEELGLICGGTPCQSFSVAGLRKGMDDPRGNLTLTFLGLLARYNPRWFVWENVPGVFSSISNGGSDFGRFLSAISELGYNCCYRVLDAQYFGVPQRRRRVFVVGHIGTDWRPPFAVLSEPESLRGHTPESRKTGERVTALTSCGVGTCGADDNQAQGGHLISVHARQDPITVEGKALPLDTKGNTQAIAIQDGRGMEKGQNGLGVDEGGPSYTLDQTGGQAVAFRACGQQGFNPAAVTPPVCATDGGGAGAPTVAFKVRGGCEGGGKGFLGSEEKAFTISTTHDQDIYHNTMVRRLTPMECERLQGFPDDYTLIPWKKGMATDGHRYKALGNSMAVPVVRWIGERIQMWEDLQDAI